MFRCFLARSHRSRRWFLNLHAQIDLPRTLGAIIKGVPLVSDTAIEEHVHGQTTVADKDARRKVLVFYFDNELVELGVHDRKDKHFIPHGRLVYRSIIDTETNRKRERERRY